jgi:hypothetical protein
MPKSFSRKTRRGGGFFDFIGMRGKQNQGEPSQGEKNGFIARGLHKITKRVDAAVNIVKNPLRRKPEEIPNIKNPIVEKPEKPDRFTPETKQELEDAISYVYRNCMNKDEKADEWKVYGPMSTWDTSNITNMDNLFAIDDSYIQRFKFKNDSYLYKITNWNTSNVNSMKGTFKGSNFNQDLDWDTSKVSSMESMFENCIFFDGILTNKFFNTNRLYKMGSMFRGCSDFTGRTEVTGTNVNNYVNYGFDFNTLGVVDMSHMFDGCVKFNPPGGLGQQFKKTYKLKNASYMFNNCKTFNRNVNIYIGDSVDVSHMFDGCDALANIPEYLQEKINELEEKERLENRTQPPPLNEENQDKELPPPPMDTNKDEELPPPPKTFMKPKTILQEEQIDEEIRPATRVRPRTEMRREGFKQPPPLMGGKRSRQTRRRSRKQSK